MCELYMWTRREARRDMYYICRRGTRQRDVCTIYVDEARRGMYYICERDVRLLSSPILKHKDSHKSGAYKHHTSQTKTSERGDPPLLHTPDISKMIFMYNTGTLKRKDGGFMYSTGNTSGSCV